MGIGRLERVRSQNEEMAFLGSTCHQLRYYAQYTDLVRAYDSQISALHRKLEADTKPSKTSRQLLKNQRQKFVREKQLHHMEALRNEVTVFLGHHASMYRPK